MQRYVAIGDSITEGVGDPLPDGALYGWADRLAAALSRRHGPVQYANLAIRGRRTAQIHREQAAPALELQPELISALVGVNDLVATRLDVGEFRGEIDVLFATLRSDGATVATSTLPDLSALLPLPHRARDVLRRRHAAVNRALSDVATDHGVLLLPLADLAAAGDRRVWCPDRLHPNPVGHALLAEAMSQLVDGVTLEVATAAQNGYGTVGYARPGAVSSAGWAGRYLLPRTIRRLRGRSSGDGRTAKFPAYVTVVDGAPLPPRSR